MKKKLVNAAKIFLFAGLGVLLTWLVIRNLTEKDKEEIIDAFYNANYYWILLTLGVGILSHLFRAFRWRLLLHPLGHYPSRTNTFFAVMIGYLANTAVPRLGEVSRCGVLNRYEKIPFEEGFGTVIAERLFDMFCFLVIFVITLAAQFDVIHTYAQEKVIAPLTKKIGWITNPYVYVTGLVFVVVVFLLWRKWQARKKGKKEGKLSKLISGFTSGLLAIKNVHRPGWFFLYTLGIWFCYYAVVHISFFAFAGTNELGAGAALACMVFGTFGFIAVQGGIGAYPLIIMQTLILFGINASVGYAFGWVAWCASTLLIILLGFLSLFLLPLMNKK